MQRSPSPLFIVMLTLVLLGFMEPGWAASVKAIFAEPVVITSAGQSSDLLLARQFFTKAGLKAPRTSALLSADSLAGVKTLVVVVGGSTKGLGQAKNATGKELARLDALLKKARASGIPVLCLHVGREARRGPLSDPFIAPVVAQAQQVLVLVGGNKDDHFTKLAAQAKIPLTEPTDYRELVSRISTLFGGKVAP